MNKKFHPKDPIPELICLKKPSKGCNDGIYEIKIPIKYMLSALEAPAAFFIFKFIGLKGDYDEKLHKS